VRQPLGGDNFSGGQSTEPKALKIALITKRKLFCSRERFSCLNEEKKKKFFIFRTREKTNRPSVEAFYCAACSCEEARKGEGEEGFCGRPQAAHVSDMSSGV
jgi:hypothetical protein